MNLSNHKHAWRCLTLLALILGDAAQATDGVVSPPDCNEAGFNNVLTTVNASGGGTITFACGSAPVTIPFTQYKTISGDVVIDGADLISFDGNDASAFFQVFNGKSLTLQRLALQHGVFADVHALENFGNLDLHGVTMKNNVSTVSAIQNNGGAMLITSSAFNDNAISGVDGGDGAALGNTGGTVTIVGSTFANNAVSTTTFGNGGAISNDSGGDLQVYSSTFTGNRALDGGAIDNQSGTISVSHSTFTGNAAGYGGAIESFGSEVDVSDSHFIGNTASDSDGGAIWNVDGQLNVDRSEFVGNQQTSPGTTGGGAISCYGGAASITQSAFSANASAGNGGAIFSFCGVAAINSTFHANSANATSGGGGAIALEGATQGILQYTTIAANTAAFGAVYDDGASGGALFLSRTLLAGNGGGNCAGVLTTNGYNLSDDTTCGGAFDPVNEHDLSSANLPLGPYQNNGGATPTMAPAAGNQAIDHVAVADCIYPEDQRGAQRPAGSGCDSGAMELGGIIDAIFTDGFDLQ